MNYTYHVESVENGSSQTPVATWCTTDLSASVKELTVKTIWLSINIGEYRWGHQNG